MTVQEVNERKVARIRREIAELEAERDATPDGQRGPLQTEISKLRNDAQTLEHLLKAKF